MSSTTSANTMHLRIWQQNLNTSPLAQHSLLTSSPIAKDWDIIALQEPSINTIRNTIST
ncbi:hypothetical protein PAXRUDRAFT_173568 [Paxillus rubicundulus Ve08.2h10]|uniref:Unplaced genomic scaffold scaffold_3474, whole genome shotgun sequence n=1 Tax=Paxillus rubicundulus Ve08.2h10 TaxID=930991 RepID=A0A0D0CVM5_9AGAM|nr:hypothetical protein PAXRUDRAFT_173568 [Paxillus rubicundulus Ve08.2h10]